MSSGARCARRGLRTRRIIKQAESVWVGSIRPGGSLETILKTVKGTVKTGGSNVKYIDSDNK